MDTTFNGVTVTTLEGALSLLRTHGPKGVTIKCPMYLYGTIVGHEDKTVMRTSVEDARIRVAAKRWLRANGFTFLADVFRGRTDGG